MINRALLRVKVVQILYAKLHSEYLTPKMAEKELDKSIDQAYDLYLFMLSLVPALTRFAELDIDARRNKFLPTDEDRNPNTRFVDNILAKKMAESETLTRFSNEAKFAWNDDNLLLKSFYENLQKTEHFAEYMNADVRSYEADNKLWRKIFKNDVLADANIETFLEDISVYWNDDLELVLSFVQKTIKRIGVDSNVDDEILPLYNSDDDSLFAKKLFRSVIENWDAYDEIIRPILKNWEIERVALMDTLIIKVAIAELLAFPTIPVSVTLNEYIEIAKSYSTPQSGKFVNGILDSIVESLRKNGQLIKADTKK